jgi:aminoglycoside phosphotransferase
MGGVTDRGSLLVARRHIDLALVSSAVCRPAR